MHIRRIFDVKVSSCSVDINTYCRFRHINKMIDKLSENHENIILKKRRIKRGYVHKK